jgi:rare lipoprotein A
MRAPRLFPALVFASLLAASALGCASSGGGLPSVSFDDDRDRDAEVGKASFYAHRFHGRSTASGETYDETKLTAAHRTLPFGTRVRVTNLENGRSVSLRINDRGPHRKGRVIDVSYVAAKRLGFVRDGVARVRVEVASRSEAE